jgi:hypothetical protein
MAASPEGRRDSRGFEQVLAGALRVDNSPYLHSRGIWPETLRDERFADTWRVGPRENVLFLHRDDTGHVTGFEAKNLGFTGFAAGGRKTAWQSVSWPDDRALVVTESAIDANHDGVLSRRVPCVTARTT